MPNDRSVIPCVLTTLHNTAPFPQPVRSDRFCPLCNSRRICKPPPAFAPHATRPRETTNTPAATSTVPATCHAPIGSCRISRLSTIVYTGQIRPI
jgi:hypothetical protein